MLATDNNLRFSSCPLCQSTSITFSGIIRFKDPTLYSTIPIRLKNDSELWQCSECESSFIQNVIQEMDAANLYSHGTSEDRWLGTRFEEAKTKIVTDKLEFLLKDAKKTLDVGCGSGNFLDFAKRLGCQTFGVEYSRTSLENIVQRGHQGFSSLDEVNETFDIITAFDVIEHLYDVPHFLKVCNSKLAAGGYLILLTGDVGCKSSKLSGSNWWYVQYPEHIVFPSKKFFTSYKNMEFIDWIPTYHSPVVQKNKFLSIAKILVNLVRYRIYNGDPTITPDHCLIILRKN
jgi:SAM-dependent methyltransferase